VELVVRLVEPCEPAREREVSVLLLTARTVKLRARALRLSTALALSLSTVIAKDAPTPTFPPDAAALAASSRVTALLAATRISELLLSARPEPRYAPV
jgi:hypothetical protein